MIRNVFYPLLTSLPGRYAFALFRMCKSHGLFDRVSDEFEVFNRSVSDTIKNALLKNTSRKLDITESLIKEIGFTDIFANFIKLLINNHRLKLAPKIQSIFTALVYNDQNKYAALIKSAQELNDNQKERIDQLTTEMFGQGAVISYETDKSLLSGIAIYSGGKMYDASGRNVISQISSLCKSAKV